MGTLAEAYTQSLIASLDPMNAVVKQMATQQLASAKDEQDTTRLSMIERLGVMIAAEKQGNNNGVVVAALEKMLERYAAKIAA